MKTTNEYLTKIRQFKQQFAEKYGIISIGIFGSVARGEQHEESDLDVFVELKDPDPFIMFDIKEELERICNCKNRSPPFAQKPSFTYFPKNSKRWNIRLKKKTSSSFKRDS